MTKRDRSLVEHLATWMMGWSGRELLSCQHGPNPWQPLKFWADAGALWQMAQRMPGVMNRVQEWLCRMNVGRLPSAPFLWFLENTSPRVLSEAVARATGWEETK